MTVSMVSVESVKKLLFRNKRTFPQWLREEVVIPEGDAKGCNYDPETRSFVLALLPYLTEYNEAWISASPRTGKSLLAVAYGVWRVCEYGESVQFLGPDQQTIWGIWKDKLEPILTSNPRLAAMMPGNYSSTDTPKSVVRMSNGGIIRLVFNPQSIRSYDCCCTIGTEASMYRDTATEADVVSLAMARMADHKNPLALFESTPSRDSSRHAQEVKRGTDSYLVSPCPHCGVLIKAGDPGQVQGWDVETEDLIAAYLECPECKGMIGETHREAMKKTVQIKHRNPTATVFSITVNWFHTNISIQHLAYAEWRNKNHPSIDAVRDLYQKYYAIPTTTELEKQEESEGERVGKEHFINRRGTYEMGQVPPNIIYTTAAIDVQKQWGYSVCIGWDEYLTPYLLGASTPKWVPDELQKEIEIPSPEMLLKGLEEAYLELQRFSPVSIFVDTGYKSQASKIHLVREWCKKYSTTHPLAGKEHSQFGRMQRNQNQMIPSQVRDYVDIRPQQDGQRLVFVDVDRVKSNMFDRIRQEPFSRGGFVFPKDIASKSQYIVHMLAEQPKLQANGTIRWVPVYGRGGRHDYLDATCYAFAAGMLTGAVKGIKPTVTLTVTPKMNQSSVALPRDATQQQQQQRPAMPIYRPQQRRGMGF